ncbi:MAG: hypothetical protein N2652_11215 [Kiritimatiellae bacterium]|nr:hypothetical protein [Kiritimatiellia bacterium]
MIIARAPFRISFFGGGTDFPEFYRAHGGAVLGVTLDRYAYIALHRLNPIFAHRYRASYSKTELVDVPREFQHPLIRECLGLVPTRGGVEIAHVADLPGRTGIGSSSAFTVALLYALHAFRGDRVGPEDLAREAIEVERVRVGDAGGHQDQYFAAYGGLLRLDFGPGDRVRVHRVGLPAAALTELEQRFLLFYLGREDSAQHILAEQRRRMPGNTRSLRRLTELVELGEAALLAADWTSFGRLLHEGWTLKRGLATGISNREIDAAYAAARAAGALGGKLLGAGGRGFLLIMAEPARHRRIRNSLARLQEVPVRLGQTGATLVLREPEL